MHTQKPQKYTPPAAEWQDGGGLQYKVVSGLRSIGTL